jgi:hypothetical protein
MDDVKQPKNLKLYKALKIAYIRNNQKLQAKKLKKFGYILDKDLSDPRETMVAYNPFKKKVLFVANGTDIKSEKDILTDVILAQGGIKQTPRFDDTKAILNKAHEKYKDAKFVLAGTSLGGALVNYAARPKDQTVTYNAAFTPGAKARENVENYRTEGDLISVFAPKKTTTILKAPKDNQPPKAKIPDSVLYSAFKNAAQVGAREVLTPYVGAPLATAGGFALVNTAEKLINRAGNLLKPHQLSNIQSAPIFL